MSATEYALIPDWPAPARVRALQTTRSGGVSLPPYAGFNLGDHVGDDPQAVATNRAALAAGLPAVPLWLTQVHGTTVLDAGQPQADNTADASIAYGTGAVCAIMTADCLPVLMCNDQGTVVGAAHAGWRGLCNGVLEATVAAMHVPGESLMAWLGPTIGRDAFEVGSDVLDAFTAHDAQAAQAFRPATAAGKYWADIELLARQRLAALGITRVYGGGLCTVSDPARWFSYRRDRTTGRMASLIWLQD
ncbi:peptidoglycan editing factor PgeF [Jeongeupia naejangsanensis]|uniref:Purine nucleoside phosphorylase n=1 Tax=Jeongeupia naejangsanensis TaxID=613195 RepID=A0ABS2BKR7_9NEIS|nr:peptidoglycan editing factor PgeF [Jeongeupia naejangsanensis]MBM3116212.1 peptidoglycan editing factor PgeF [Jeongeupia naejangsanensis]